MPQLTVELPEDDRLRLIRVQQLTPPVTGEGHEVGRQVVIGDPARIGHALIMNPDAVAGNLLRRPPPR